MKIILGADHGGYKIKEMLQEWLMGQEYEVIDVGAEEMREGDDFVDYAIKVAEEMKKDESSRGIVVCRNGQGMMIALNRYDGIRCGLAMGMEEVEKARADDNINALSIPADYVSEEDIRKIVDVFLNTEFSGEEKYQRRIEKLENIK